MNTVDLKEVTAIIDATGSVDKGRKVAIRYVNGKGEIREMIVSKRSSERRRMPSTQEKPARAKPHYRDNALIPILDHSAEGQPKNIFLFGIIGFNPDPDTSHFYPILRHGTENK